MIVQFNEELKESIVFAINI